MPSGKRKSEKEGKGPVAVLKGGVIGTAAAFFVLLVAALLIWRGMLTGEAGGSAAICALLIGGAVAGRYAAGQGRGRGLLAGIGGAAVTILLLSMTGALIGGRMPRWPALGVQSLASLCGGFAGAIMRAKPKRTRKKAGKAETRVYK